ncbi:hypothetical protein Cni_G24906 [Canna indica]|uniref:Uncharacterized protein n=1 Tax=Canna indica TaxID=4628 RepID=A0AAQ3QLW4_9LILI|nr:hypothetical protein Cni_G24906 [Canna indica]
MSSTTETEYERQLKGNKRTEKVEDMLLVHKVSFLLCMNKIIIYHNIFKKTEKGIWKAARWSTKLRRDRERRIERRKGRKKKKREKNNVIPLQVALQCPRDYKYVYDFITPNIKWKQTLISKGKKRRH